MRTYLKKLIFDEEPVLLEHLYATQQGIFTWAAITSAIYQ